MMSGSEAIGNAIRLASKVGNPVSDAEVDGTIVRQAVRLAPDESPVELLIDARGMDPLIRSREVDARDVFPDVNKTEGAMRIAAENILAEIASGPGPISSAGVDRHGRVWRSEVGELPTEISPEGNFRWDSGR
jgi:hypothetical protein